MAFISPMLASGMPKKPLDFSTGKWIAEEKYDGHRLVVEVDFRDVTAWGRYGIERALPDELKYQLAQLGRGIYDGELIVPGGQSHNVVELTRQNDLTFVAFDILQSYQHNVMWYTWEGRRDVLGECFEGIEATPNVRMSHYEKISDHSEAERIFQNVLRLGGEGLILKDKYSEYLPGKRPAGVWVKMKDKKTAVMEIIGFSPGKNGPFSRALVEGDDTRRTTVKVLNDALLAEVHRNPASFIGRQLRIEFQGRTPDGSYRHPRWDHLLDEE